MAPIRPEQEKRMSNEAENWLALLCGVLLVLIVLLFINHSPSIVSATQSAMDWVMGFRGIW